MRSDHPCLPRLLSLPEAASLYRLLNFPILQTDPGLNSVSLHWHADSGLLLFRRLAVPAILLPVKDDTLPLQLRIPVSQADTLT